MSEPNARYVEFGNCLRCGAKDVSVNAVAINAHHAGVTDYELWCERCCAAAKKALARQAEAGR